MKIYSSPDRYRFDQVFVAKDYALMTLLNGNITESICYMKDLLATGQVGIGEVHDQLIKIREQVPERYEYVKKQVFNPLYRPNNIPKPL